MLIPLDLRPPPSGPKRVSSGPVSGQAKRPEKRAGSPTAALAGRRRVGRATGTAGVSFAASAGSAPGLSSSMSTRNACARCSSDMVATSARLGSSSRWPVRRMNGSRRWLAVVTCDQSTP